MSWRPSVCVITRQLHHDFGRNVTTAACADALTSSKKATHTLRALLRECSYLPDPQARSYLSQHILLRYRAYTYTNKDDKDICRQVRLQTQRQAAQSALNQLRRANQGEWHPLMKALLLTYGRIGKRRWDLMRPLLPAEGQDGEGAGEARTPSTAEEDEKKKPLPSLTPQLHALLLSHSRAEPPTLTRRNPSIKNLKPDVPKLNSWLRPMPQSRVRNLTKRWYRDLLERVLPPLPKEEWERLKRLAKGEVVEDMVVKRRSKMEGGGRGKTVSNALEAMVAGGKVPSYKVKRDVHNITPRFMRRLWAKVFVQCPLVEWDGEKERWTVVWGEHVL